MELIAAAYDAKGVSADRTWPVMVPKSLSKQSDVGPKSAGAPRTEGTGSAKGGLRSEVWSPEQKEKLPLRGEVNSSEQKEALPLRSEVGTERLEFDRTQFIIASDEARQKWKIEGAVSKEVKTKLDRCKSLLSRKYLQGVDYDILLGELAEVFLERTDPQRKQERRKKREAKQKCRARTPSKARAPESRHIPAREKEKVWIRDRGRCTYVGSNGKRCNSTHNLEFDHHPIPFAPRRSW